MTTFTNQTKHSASFSNQSKNTNVWDIAGTSLLLLESGYKLLFETGDSIILEQSGSITSNWSNQIKN